MWFVKAAGRVSSPPLHRPAGAAQRVLSIPTRTVNRRQGRGRRPRREAEGRARSGVNLEDIKQDAAHLRLQRLPLNPVLILQQLITPSAS